MNNPRLEPLIRIFALYPLVDQVFCLIPAFMISLDRPLRAGWYTLIRSIGHMGSIVIVFALGYPVSTVLWVAIGFGAVVSAIGVADMAYLSPGGGWRFRGELIKEQMSYAWPLLATAVVGTLNLQFGRLLISAFFDPAVYAVYSCGAFEVPILAVVTTSIAAAMMPNLVVLAKEGKKQAALNLWQEAARKASFLVFPCFAFLLFASADLTVLLYGPPYARAVWPFAIFLGLLPLRVAVYATLFRAFGQTKPLAISAVIALFVNATVSLALVWGCKGTLLAFIGPCIGTLCSAMAMATYLLKTLSRLVGVPVSGLMRWRELGWTLAAALLCGALMFLVPLGGLPLAVKIAVQGIIFTTAFAALAFWTRMLQEDELELLYWPVRTARRLLAGRRPD